VTVLSANAGSRRTAPALALAFLAGATLATQAFVNGRLGKAIDSPLSAAFVNQAVGFTLLLILGFSLGALPRAWRRYKSGPGLTWWQWLASANGALFVTVTTAAAPKVGVALLTVAIVCGQTVGSLAIDWKGLGPSGPRPLTAARVGGVALAIMAVLLGAVETHRDLHVALLSLAVLGGAGTALVQAALGQVTLKTGEPIAAASLSFFVGGAVILLMLLVTDRFPPDGWSAPPEWWIGGLLGAPTAIIMGLTVGRLGVLRLTLAIVAGQSVGGLVIDLIAPASGAEVSLRTLLSIGLTFAAVAVSGMATTRAGPRIRVRQPATAQTALEGTLPPAGPGPVDRV
jgi:bacterial/archaeal transporter family-2 protein